MDIQKLIDQRCEGREGAPAHLEQVDLLSRILWLLLQPDGCSWDRKQTHKSLARHMVEEGFEAADAMESGDIDNLVEELGDVLLQVALHSAIAERDGEFTFDDVARTLNEKLVRRHPHVFGETAARDSEEALSSWQDVKKTEKKDKSSNPFDSVSLATPALLQAQLLQERALSLPDNSCSSDVSSSVSAKLETLTQDRLSKEEAETLIGDVLFSLVSVARDYNVDAEGALRGACRAFRSNSNYDVSD